MWIDYTNKLGADLGEATPIKAVVKFFDKRAGRCVRHKGSGKSRNVVTATRADRVYPLYIHLVSSDSKLVGIIPSRSPPESSVSEFGLLSLTKDRSSSLL